MMFCISMLFGMFTIHIRYIGSCSNGRKKVENLGEIENGYIFFNAEFIIKLR